MKEVVTRWTCSRCDVKEFTDASRIQYAGATINTYKPGAAPQGWMDSCGLILCPGCKAEFQWFMKGGGVR